MSIQPGVQNLGEIDPSIHITTPDDTVKAGQPVTSVTQNPFTPVEFGRTATQSLYDLTANSAGGEISGGGAGGGGGVVAPTIGTVTVSGSATQTVGTGSTYSATISGTATDAVYTWTTDDASAVISDASAASTSIQFSTAGSFTATCTVTSATSTPASAVGSKSVTVSAAVLTLDLSSTDFTDGGALPLDVGVNFTGNPTNPALAWTLAGDVNGTVASYKLLVVDTDAGNYVHWDVTNIAASVTSITAAPDPTTNNWTGTPTINTTDGGPGAAFANGWEGPAPPGGSTHNYRFQVQGLDAGGNTVVTSNLLTGTYTG
jgi:phosphatidylethanolamine-binding protein (PEBP) family uncharacterized protein